MTQITFGNGDYELLPCPFCGRPYRVSRREVMTAKPSADFDENNDCPNCGGEGLIYICEAGAGEMFAENAKKSETSPPSVPGVDTVREALEQIKAVCTDNDGDDCGHRLALRFVANVAARALASLPSVPGVEREGIARTLYEIQPADDRLINSLQRIRCWWRGYHVGDPSAHIQYKFRYDVSGMCFDCGKVGSGQKWKG